MKRINMSSATVQSNDTDVVKVGSPFSCYSKENYIVKYPLLPLSGFPYRITQYILKFPILIIAEILSSNTLIYRIT